MAVSPRGSLQKQSPINNHKSNETRQSAQELPLGVCLVSGGLDSCVTAAIAARSCCLAFLHVNYGQLTEERELMAFDAIADHYGVKHRLKIDISYLKFMGGSALTDPTIPVPEESLGESGVPVTYVPFRNTHMLAMAVSWAEVLGAGYIYIGATEVDSSGYPDCRKSYFDAYKLLIKEGTRPETKIEIITPLIDYDKGMVVKEGLALKAPLHLTWSCYQNQDVACGKCDSCLLRIRGFAAAGVPDPIQYVI
ncbi:MAG: 7-cyano-7-deazaguanine synthase QueC [Deltaproteobacteria bacterium]|nr:7-cyano-7-deazaguanine synthase QueC [Deltaproteobacteria bacterium]MBW1938124.1 7-cyano-7-deazaguanine synthase QueC [Deltaproteobacteria bacterium]MBW1964580.1 7-cyano-7-deazaguanine synthase QueC [Deltaproteobacteria bacterium]MBW2350015.1 7-cyano-7-deazaguanine synthase QueC [Deltaproteobacteria bacterium]